MFIGQMRSAQWLNFFSLKHCSGWQIRDVVGQQIVAKENKPAKVAPEKRRQRLCGGGKGGGIKLVKQVAMSFLSGRCIVNLKTHERSDEPLGRVF